MTRIGGGGGPFVPPQTQAQGAQPAQQTQQTQQADFAKQVAQAQSQGTDAARTAQAKTTQQSQLTGKAKDIAKRLANKELDAKGATREFVSLVIEERFPQFKKRKKKKDDDEEGEENEEKEEGEDGQSSPEDRLEEAVTELIDRDPVLATRLATQFKKLATKG